MMGLYFCKASSKAMLTDLVLFAGVCYSRVCYFAGVVVYGRVSEIKVILVSETMSLTTNQRLSGNTCRDRCPQDV